MIDNPIGHKVHQLVKRNEESWFYTIDQEYTYEVVRVIGYDEVKNDYCRHFIIKGEDGTEKEVREFECVFVPDTTKEETEMLYRYLSDNGVYADVYHYSHDVPAIVVSISWGDWKHDHGWANTLMGYLGYTEIGNQVTEENGSDCYSAEHYYLKMKTLADLKAAKDIATRENE